MGLAAAITEHRALKVACPCCGAKVQAEFPQGVNQPVQYGPRILGFGAYLHADHLIPLFRSALIVQRLTGALFNSGTLHSAMKLAFERLSGFEEQAKQSLSQAENLHADETSTRVAESRYWFQHPSLRVGTRLYQPLDLPVLSHSARW